MPLADSSTALAGASTLQRIQGHSDDMTVEPEFGGITQVLAVVFGITGIGAALAMLSAGSDVPRQG